MYTLEQIKDFKKLAEMSYSLPEPGGEAVRDLVERIIELNSVCLKQHEAIQKLKILLDSATQYEILHKIRAGEVVDL
jgi:hypothetical protein